MSDRGSQAPRRRRSPLSPMDGRETYERRVDRSGSNKDYRRTASPLDSEEEERRVRKEGRRQRSPADARTRYARHRSTDRSVDRRKTKERSLSREGHRADDRVKRRDDYERRRHDGDDDNRKRSSRHGRHDDDEDRKRSTHRRRSHSRSRSPPPRRREHRSRPSPSPSGSRPLTARSRSPPVKRRRRSPSRSASRSPPPPRKSRSSPHRKARGPLASQEESFRGGGDSAAVVLDETGKPIEKQKPNFNATGLLAREANTVAGTNTVLKYHEPSEARKPPSKQQWRVYVFKGDDIVDTIHIYTRSCWLMGRDEKICDYHIQHPSASKQHAVVQFRYITKTNEFGEREGKVKPYFIDLESANGSTLNGKKVDAGRYVELLDGDVLVFGESDRQYVMMLPPP